MRVIIITAAVLLLGFVLCPRPPSGDRVDPNALASNMLRALKRAPGHDRPGYTVTSFLDSLLRKTKWTPLVEGEEKIAGRDAWIVRFKPDRKRVPWAHCWVDKETFVILAARVWDGRNRLIRSFKTTKIIY